MKIALGTVQLGLSYGIANTTGQVDFPMASAILHRASEAGVDTLDTAIVYGKSERCLGEIGVKDYRIITKLPALPTDCVDVFEWVGEQVDGSLHRLGVKSLAGLLLHRPGQLLESGGIELWSALLQLKCDGIIEKIGFSIYAPDELDELWGLFQPDIVQSPYNIFDRRLATSGWLERMNESGVEVHVRSIFLQGLLLMDMAHRPAKFDRWYELWGAWHKWLRNSGITPLQATLAFALSEARISRVIVGVDSLTQFEEILSAIVDDISDFPDALSVTDPALLNPSHWNAL